MPMYWKYLWRANVAKYGWKSQQAENIVEKKNVLKIFMKGQCAENIVEKANVLEI